MLRNNSFIYHFIMRRSFLSFCAVLVIGCCQLQAQRNEALYDFDSVKYKISNWTTNEMMHVSIEKYGALWAAKVNDVDSLVARIKDGRSNTDVGHMLSVSTLPTVRALLGYWPGINAEDYDSLHAAVSTQRTPIADTVISRLKAQVLADTAAINKTIGEINVTLEDTVKLDTLLTQWANMRGANTVEDEKGDLLMKLDKAALPNCGEDKKICRSSLQRSLILLKESEASRKASMLELFKVWNKGATPMVKGYPNVVSTARKEIQLKYIADSTVLDTLMLYCDTVGETCDARKEQVIDELYKRVDKISREFTCVMPIAAQRVFFELTFSDALLELSGRPTDKVLSKEAGRLAEVNFYRILTEILVSSTPDAGELCANRELLVYRRKPRVQVWAERRNHRAGKDHPGVVIAGWGKKRVYEHPEIKDTLASIGKRGWSDTTSWSRIRELTRKTTRISSRFETNPYITPHQLTIINRRKLARLRTPSRLRHFRYNGRASFSVDDHDRFPLSVDQISIKFQDGVIEDIVVLGEVKETFRFLLERDGTHMDSILIPHHYKARGKEVIHEFVRTAKVTFTNSNTPIPFGNVWDFYERYADRMPLYGYSHGSGIGYRGTDEPDYMLLLSDLLHYDPALQKATSNIAPGDTLVKIDFRRPTENGSSAASSSDHRSATRGPGAPATAKGSAGNSTLPPPQLCAGLKKDDLRKVGEFRVYTDLVGLARNKPNGLLQTEYAWRLPVKPRTAQGVNFVSYVEPYFHLVLREDEEQRAYLGLDTSTTRKAVEQRVVDPLALLANNMYQVGSRLTAVQLSVRYLRSEFEFNPFIGYTRTMARDSVLGGFMRDSVLAEPDAAYRYFNRQLLDARDLEGIGQLTYGTEIRWKLRPDGRFGFDVYGGVAWHRFLDTRFKVDDELWRRRGMLWHPNMMLAGLDAHLFASPSQRFFFKFRYIAAWRDANDHFVQLMFGYNRSLRFSRSDDEKIKARDAQIKQALLQP